MRPLLPILLASLFTVLPALAQEAAAPADPELAALEQEILDAFLWSNQEWDFDNDGHCDVAERDFVMRIFEDTAPGEGGFDLVRNALLHADMNLFYEHRQFPVDYQRQHPGPLQGRELRLAIEKEKALNAIADLANLPKSDGWRKKLLAQLVQEEDLNHNGILDHEELVRRGELDRLLKIIFGWTFDMDFDFDNDGILDKAEHDAVVDLQKEDLDFDNDGQISINDLQVLANLPVSLRNSLVQIPFKEDIAAFSRKYLPSYDLNGDRVWQPQEMELAGKVDNALHCTFDCIAPSRSVCYSFSGFKDEVKNVFVDQLMQQLLKYRDLNGNGRIDLAEIPSTGGFAGFGPDPLDLMIGAWLADAQPPIPPATLEQLSQQAFSLNDVDQGPNPTFRYTAGGKAIKIIKIDDKAKVLDCLHRQPLAYLRLSRDSRIPAESRADIMKSLLTLYDSNHDGQLDTEEAWVGRHLETFWRDKFYRGKPLALAQRRAWLDKIMAIHDRNRDGRLSRLEAFHGTKIEKEWLFIQKASKAASVLDKNGDGWLDSEERQPLEREILKDYDLNHNGTLETKELMRFYEDLAFSDLWQNFPPLSPEEKADWQKNRWKFDFNQNGHPDIIRISNNASCILFDHQSNGKKMDYQTMWKWYQFMLDNYDSNHNGQIENYELCDYERLAYEWGQLASWRKLPSQPSSIPELRQWVMEQGDANHDGQLSLSELSRLNRYLRKLSPNNDNYLRDEQPLDDNLRGFLCRLQKMDKARPPTMADLKGIDAFVSLLQCMIYLHPEFRKDNPQSQEPLRRLAEYLLKTEDRNGDGRLDYAECYRLIRLNHVKFEEAGKQQGQEQKRLNDAQQELFKHQQQMR